MYIFLSGFIAASSLTLKRQFGKVFDSKTGLPLPDTVIRLFDIEYGQLVQERVTDKLGRYRFLVSPGKYYLMALSKGYQPLQTDLIIVKPGGTIEKNLEMER